MNSAFSGNFIRIGIAISSLLLVGALLFPIWKIDLTAPQYPEGLSLKIWSYKLGGNVETVNGLNHYIGMKKLDENEFVEFKVLPYLLLFFCLSGLLIALVNKRKLLFAWMILFIIFSGLSVTDFYYWEYNYGHNLDPTAPIQVPGMAYQPPLIGYKQMLNFSAFSIPDTGGWFFIASGVLMFAISIYEWKKWRSLKLAIMALTFSSLSITGCQPSVKPIVYGKDICAFCKMTIVDNKFAVQLVSLKGRVYNLDDMACAKNFLKSGSMALSQLKQALVSNYNSGGHMLELNKSTLVWNENLNSPMGGKIAAFNSPAEADDFINLSGGKRIASSSFFD